MGLLVYTHLASLRAVVLVSNSFFSYRIDNSTWRVLLLIQYPLEENGYRGNDAQKKRKAADFNEIASAIESHVNGLL